MRLVFIRHGKTKGNTEHRYIGRTDESLCPEGMQEVTDLRSTLEEVMQGGCQQGGLPVDTHCPDVLFVSPMKRCVESAKLFFPGMEQIVADDLREYDFGAFEGKNYEELKNDPDYSKWLESDGKLPFPAGEGMENFRERSCRAFEETLKFLKMHFGDETEGKKTAAYVVHGGTIMSIFSKYHEETQDYYDYQCKNADGYVVKWDGTFPCRLTGAEKISLI